MQLQELQVLPLDAAHRADVFWQRVAERAGAWLAEQGASVRDAVLLLPFAQQLAPARRAWVQRSAQWQPRIETTHSLAAALGPNYLAQAQQISFDPAIDALSAAQLLQGQSWAQELRRRDPRAFRLALTRLVEAAHALLRAAYQRAPARREAFWQQARQVLAEVPGPGRLERALAAVALEWAASDGRQAATDALFELRPSAWIQVQAGGPDPLARALLDEAAGQGVPALCLVADVELDEVFAEAPPLGRIEEALCSDFEDLAQCTAACVLQHLAAGRAPLALVAQDRVLVRRVRALLERQQVPMLDETGWTLATTPPAAQLMALLRAAAPQAGLDEWLAWLKSDLARDLRERAGGAALPLLEARCRAKGWRMPQALRADLLAPSSARLWELAGAALAGLREGAPRRSLADWLAALQQALQLLRAEPLLQQHEAGEKVLDALWLSRSPWPDSAHEAALREAQLRYADFVAWIDETLEAQQYVPPAGVEPQLVITPLARAMLRPFGAVVLPGADAQTLGAGGKLPALLSDAQALAIGLPDLQQQREALAYAFAQTLRAPALSLLRCHAIGAEPLAASPLLDRLQLALARGGHAPLAAWRDERPQRALLARPQPRAAARAGGLLPASLSASGLESLRNCPYQFFARALLGLQEQEELEATADKRDYGTWLHAVLHRFHEQRLAAETPEDDGARLQRLALEQQAQQGLAPAEFLPFMASFERFAPRYLAWLAEAEAAGQHYAAGELERSVQPFADAPLQGLVLRGRIDRVDEQGADRVLIDYKTGSLQGLKAKVARPLEDTQLAFYAALMAPELGAEAALQARYLALDDGKGIAEVEHPEVERTVARLLAGVADDLRALHGGAPLPALGEGSSCSYCKMRGLCRRDDWSEAAP
ncbi:PD-(D/E)XK nuclease family protein [Roseateles violae]|uniref:PD-(D/E)XK nuclease family protein n=1 Tax=Roseateles violae TaxID=3058042 RepID=A0ABT8DPW7_9BURK|nr:PD-(D/E)XK nuclease family protein [Pelomonas sp. PFR6]MDN3920396.1 PD-(D/E)XK nuclease family protein [Pelomonas sp. PFR6]